MSTEAPRRNARRSFMFPPSFGTRRSYSFFMAPRTFRPNNPTCSAISAQACVCQPHVTHRTLLATNHQNPASRRDFFCDATSQAANSVTAMAGHWMASSQSNLLSTFVGAFQRRDVEFSHLEQRGHGPLALLVGIAEPVDHLLRHHLPGQAVLVLEPAAHVRLRIAAGGQLAPVVIELLLVLDIHLQGDRFVELEEGSAVECREGLAVEFELHGEHGAFLLAVRFEPGLAVAGDLADLRIREDADVVT